MITKDIERIIHGVLKPKGYKKRGVTWYHHHPDVIHVLNLQREFGTTYFLNAAIFIRALGNDEYPKEQHCHIRIRAEQIVMDGNLSRTLLHFEPDSSLDFERAQAITLVIEKTAMWLQRLDTIAAVKREAIGNDEVLPRTILKARKFLKLD